LPARVGFGDSLTVEENRDRVAIFAIPVRFIHLLARRAEPDNIGHFALPPGAAEEPPPPEYQVLMSERNEQSCKLDQIDIRISPVYPGDLVVLTVGIVVALLGAAWFIARLQQRDTLGEQKRRKEIALLPPA
jgi:hypothetical protein